MSILDSLDRYIVIAENENFLNKLINKFRIAIPKTRDLIIRALADAIIRANSSEINAIRTVLTSTNESTINENIFSSIRGIFDNAKIATIVVLLLVLVPKTAEAKNIMDMIIDKAEEIHHEGTKDLAKQKKDIETFITKTIPEKAEYAAQEAKEKAIKIAKDLKAKSGAIGDSNNGSIVKPDSTKIDLNNPGNI